MKFTRQTMLCFGSSVGAGDIGIFGSLAAGSPTCSTVIATIQSLPNWGSGWAAEVIAGNRPALEDMNAFCYVTSYGLFYLYEMGIPEYDAGTTYYENSYCQVAGTVYYSLQDSNINNAPASSPTYWTAGVKGVSTFPSGGIIMWSGSIASIPSGWYLCDGSNGTPDLRDRFIVGAKQDSGGVAKTNVTGSLTQSGDGIIPAHTHGYATPALKTKNADGEQNDYWSGSSSANTDSAGSGTKNIAVYYALAFIMRA